MLAAIVEAEQKDQPRQNHYDQLAVRLSLEERTVCSIVQRLGDDGLVDAVVDTKLRHCWVNRVLPDGLRAAGAWPRRELDLEPSSGVWTS